MAASVIRDLLDQAFPGGEIDVEDRTGGGDHFQVTVVAAACDGVSLIQQHKLVNEIFTGELGGSIHALSIKTQTPEAAKT